MSNVKLSDRQQEALDLALSGKNLFITGSGGVGKSFVLEQIVSQLELKRKRVGITAPTGIAALAIGGSTIHSWAGVGQGKESAAKLLESMRYFKKARARWTQSDVLVMDEISMLDPELMEKLDQIGKSLRRNQRPFGGLQLILLGDFFQLPPVFAEKDGPRTSSWEFVFETPVWQALGLEVVILTEVYRQRDREFVQVLESIRHGQVTPEGLALLQSRVGAQLDCSDGIEPTQLYARLAAVAKINEDRLKELAGPEFSYDYRQTILGCSNDTRKQVEQRLLRDCPADGNIKLRRGAQVMLLVNLDQERGLVNGSRGVVIGFQGEETELIQGQVSASSLIALNSSPQRLASPPIVKFTNGCIEVFGYHGWRIENRLEGWNATHYQVPLKLAWAVTIHKAQGMTLDRVTVNLGSSIFGVGMTYVALSRVRTPEGLTITQLDAQKIQAHPRVLAYYSQLRERIKPMAEVPKAPPQASIKRFLVERESESKRVKQE